MTCANCGKTVTLTERMIDGKPVSVLYDPRPMQRPCEVCQWFKLTVEPVSELNVEEPTIPGTYLAGYWTKQR